MPEERASASVASLDGAAGMGVAAMTLGAGFCFLAVAQIHSVVFPRAIRRVVHLVVARAVAIDVHVITVTCNFVVIASYRGAESQVLYSRRMVGGFADYFRCASSHMCVVTIECDQ